MLNIVLFGPPGAGKGTQAEKLVAKYSLCHLSTGDIFRSNIKGETQLGKLAKSYMDKGELVPDSVTIAMLELEVNNNKQTKGFIFDGFPRTTPQAQALDDFLQDKATGITVMLALEVEEEELIKRILSRGVHSGRADDNDKNIIANRIEVYKQQTAIVADFYHAQDKYERIEGVGGIDAVFEKLCDAIDKYKSVVGNQ